LSARRLAVGEFVALMAMLSSLVAFSIDSMLPALPRIAAELSPDAVNRAQLVVAAFMLGLGLGTMLAGPLADAFGRRPVIVGGIAVYMVGAAMAYLSGSLNALLLARLIQGLAIAGPRVASMAMVRDLYAGRRMARISSFITTVFMLVPAIAPSLGAAVIHVWGWRAVFLAFVAFSGTAGLWLTLRQGETLAPEHRRPFRPAGLRDGFREVVRRRVVLVATLAMAAEFGALVSLLSSTQQIYAQVFHRPDSFPLWFAATAVLGAGGTIANGVLVVRLGMRRLVLRAFAAQALACVIAAALLGAGLLPAGLRFALWFAWSAALLVGVGMIMGNLVALALRPLGHAAGMAASVVTAASTILGVALAAPVGLAFDGTPLPLILGTGAMCALGWGLIRLMLDEGQLRRP